MAKRLLILFMFFSLSSCDKNDVNQDDSGNTIRKDTELIRDLRAQSVGTLQIGSQKYNLKAALWRDFMPVSPPNGKPLISKNQLVSTDYSAIPSNIQLMKQYVIMGDSVWTSDYQDGSSKPNEYTIEKTSLNGPKWGPNVGVDVVAKVNDSNTNKDYFIKLENVNIDRTD